jgi:hypothetical protein
MRSAASVPIELSHRSSVPLMVRVAPALIGLLYPALVWSVYAFSPFALAMTLLAPGVGCVPKAVEKQEGDSLEQLE